MKRGSQKQHYVPRCWLKGFTESGEKGGQLYVTNLVEKTQRRSSPAGCGYEVDFYKLSEPGVDPKVWEDALGLIETSAGPIFARMFSEHTEPLFEEMDAFLTFVAVQFSRVPAFRPFLLSLTNRIHREFLEHATRDTDNWEASGLERIREEYPDFSREKAIDLLRNWDSFSYSAPIEWFMIESLKAVKTIYPRLRQRQWPTLVSLSGSFIGSDNPVYLDGEPDKKIGFASRDAIVIFPANRHCLVLGTPGRTKPIHVTRNMIARQNTLTMLEASEEVFSHRPDFCWMDGGGNFQTDWRLFDKGKVLEEHARNIDSPTSFTAIHLY